MAMAKEKTDQRASPKFKGAKRLYSCVSPIVKVQRTVNVLSVNYPVWGLGRHEETTANFP